MGVRADLNTVPNADFLRTVVHEIGDALPDRIAHARTSAHVVLVRQAAPIYGGYLDPIELSVSGDESVSVSTSLSGHPEVITHFSAAPGDDLTVRRHITGQLGKSEVLPDIATPNTLTYDEYLDALALDLGAACREMIEMDDTLLADDDKRALYIAQR